MTPPPTCDHWTIWRAAVADATIDGALRRLYEALDAQIRGRGPICWTSGRCCNFDAMGHRLYVAGLEIAWLLHRLPPPSLRGGAGEGGQPHGLNGSAISLTAPCPFQRNNLCTVHALRPLGCRVFFCQRGTQAWQHDLYERFLSQLRHLHDAHGLPYRYLEWRAGLREALA